MTERTRKRHTFVFQVEENERGWQRVTKTFRVSLFPGPGHRPQLMSLSDPLPATVNLAKSVDIPAAALAIILEALVSDSRHTIDLADINKVVSELGPRLVALDSLDEERRRLAEPALYREILARCTNI